MDHVVKILWILAVYSASLQDMSVHGMVDFSSPWDTRVSSTLDFLQRDPCWGLSRGPKCNRSIFSNLNTRNIMLYTAETQRKLRVILPEKKERRLTSDSKNNSYDAVFVLDPFPDANLGRTRTPTRSPSRLTPCLGAPLRHSSGTLRNHFRAVAPS